MRAWLGHRHLPEEGIRAKVPVSLHDHGAHDATLANRDSYFFVDLPVGEARTADRILAVNRQTAERKRLHDAEALYAASVHRSVSRRAMSPRVFTLNVSNVPGPRDDVYVLGARVRELIEQDGSVLGVRYSGVDGPVEIRAPLTVGADGRFSKVRQLAGFELLRTDQPRDVLSFRVPARHGRPGLYAHPKLGYAVVVPRAGEACDPEELKAFVRERIAASFGLVTRYRHYKEGQVAELVDPKRRMAIARKAKRLGNWLKNLARELERRAP
jgi:2-polyprenyl-6-methoxyphenol hydroxylase-like FAD-dependent oxidoreductase